jgi:ABC-type antimicrobial peptide transport system permease subunit
MRSFVLRARGETADLAPVIREVMHAVDPGLPLQALTTQAANVRRLTAPERTIAMASALFAALSLVISAIGIFGVLSYSVARRTREIGIRMAVGAGQRRIVASIMGETLLLAAAGGAAGLLLALWAARFIAARLYGLAPNDAATIAGAAGLLLAASMIAAYLPARKAAKADPWKALRHD